MSSAKCQTCGVEILAATAQRTADRCMPCAIDADPKFAEEVAAKRDTATHQNTPLWQQFRDLLLIFVVGGAVLAILFIAQILVSILAGLVAKFIFRTTWAEAVIVGMATYGILGFIGLILNAFDSDTRSFNFKRKPPKK